MTARWILDDAETSLLAALHTQSIGPTEVASMDGAIRIAQTTHAFESERLSIAFETLVKKQLVEPLGDGRVRLTRAGFLQTHEAAERLGAGITNGI
jgi:hypothetical protein